MTLPAAEQSWVRDAQAGSADAFSRLVSAHQGALRAFLRRLCSNWAEADDLAQDTFVFAWESFARFEPERSFRAWLFGIGWHKYRQSRRSLFRLLRREQVAAETRTMASPDLALQLDLDAAIRSLPASQRGAVLLCLACEFTHAEAAQALDIPLGTVKSHVARARDKLMAVLGDIRGHA
jgi:RNA polymerase sigma-70 factor, ECF subfamily